MTSTSRFGTSKRESHDASDFYDRFPAPTLLDDTTVVDAGDVKDSVIHGDSRDLSMIPDNSIALVVTSPPYFAGKEYEAVMGEGHVPASYVEYLEMLRDVFAECWRVLEPGGRVAVNVANLGRKPYRSLAGDVVDILQNDLGYLLRGEVVWIKGAGLNSSCAWGSYASASNPVLRDVTERIIVGSKGRFGRALSKPKRKTLGLPHEDTITGEEFRELTLDTWRFPPESARRVGHPAPFPVELPRRCLELFTFKDDTVLDPFGGVGTVGVAAVQTGRHYVCVDADAEYVEKARTRIAEAVDAKEAAVFDLTGKVALVTGSGQSVGAGIAWTLAAQGATVVVNDVVASRAGDTAGAIEHAGGKAYPIAFDVTKLAEVDASVAEIETAVGPVDILVNNAGNAGAPGMIVSQFREMDPAVWERFVAVNLYGVLNCSRAVIDGMCERGWGRVITISSGAGVVGMRMGISIYAAAKSGSIGFMRHLAMEVARQGVTANTLALGLMGVQELTELTRDTARQIPVGRLGSPEDVGAACAYLASDEAAWMTGQTINLNGGATTT